MARNDKRPLMPRTASYDPDNGRAASSSREPMASHSYDGHPCHPWAPRAQGQPGKGSPTWDAKDRARTQGGSVSKRPLG